MRELTARCAAAALVVWLGGAVTALAAPIHEILPYTWSQQGLTITDQAGDFESWDTHLRYTNTTAETLYDVRLWFYGGTLNGSAAQWDSTTLTGTTASGLTWFAGGGATHIALGSSNIPIPAGFGLDANAQVPTWLLGDIAPGAFADVHAIAFMSDAVNGAFFPGFAFTQTAPVPEPGSLLLLAAGAGALGRRLRRRMPLRG